MREAWRTVSCLTPIFFWVGLIACDSPEAPAPMPDMASVRLEGVELSDVIEGELGGEHFEAVDVRYRVTLGERRERVDLYVSDRSIERCGLPIARADTLLWLRVSGVSELEVGELSTADEELEVHYERPGEGGIEAVHRGQARINITAIDEGVIEGSLRVCLADAEGSCAGGRFRATPCLSRIDGRALREPPGLSDEAIEATGEAP